MKRRPRIRRLQGDFAIHRLPADHPLPEALATDPLVVVGRTEAELSVVCRQRPELAGWGEVSGDWGALEARVGCDALGAWEEEHEACPAVGQDGAAE